MTGYSKGHFGPMTRVMRIARSLSYLVIPILFANCVYAHKASDSYLKLKSGGGGLTARWDVAIKDLELLIGIDANQDGDVTWGELKSKQNAIVAHALSQLQIEADGQTCKLRLIEMKVTEHSDGCYAVLELSTGVGGAVETLKIDYSFLFEEDPTHRGLVLFESHDAAITHVLSPAEPNVQIKADETSLRHAFFEYTKEGVWHIWIGFDHILFLICLLLPAVLTREEAIWHPVRQFRPAFCTVSKIVTVFTIAHSITLWLAVMQYVTLPSQLVESAIAFSIIVTAANNLFPVLKIPSWMIAFVFGLIHGFGFANVLLDLGLSSMTLGVSLFGFNVGVELGQIAIVAVFLPIAFVIRGTKFYELVVLKLGSILIVCIAVIWMVERIANVEIIGI